MGDATRNTLYYVQESSYGVTPSSDPTLKYLRNTAGDISLAKDTFASEELYGDRQMRHFRHGAQTVTNEITGEMSASTYDDLLEAALSGTWSTDVLKVGTTKRSFSIIKHYGDLSSVDKPYHISTGVTFTGLNLTVPLNGIVTAGFPVLGRDLTAYSDLSALGTPTLGTPETTEPFNGLVGAITEGGSSIAILTEISLTLDNGTSAKHVLGGEGKTLQPSQGMSNLTGTITAYFPNSTLFEKFKNETGSSLSFVLTDPAGNTYTFLIPNLKYTDGAVSRSNNDNVISLPFQALYDETTGTNLQITRSLV